MPQNKRPVRKTRNDYRPAVIRLPALPDLPLPVALDKVDNTLWFGLRAACAGLRIDYPSQYLKLESDEEIAPYLALVPMSTKQGTRPVLALEFRPFGQWIADIEQARLGDSAYAEYIGILRQGIWKAANTLLMHKPVEIAQSTGVFYLTDGSNTHALLRTRPVGLQSQFMELQDRVLRVEDLLAVTGAGGTGEESDEDLVVSTIATTDGTITTVHTTCPHCGGALRIEQGRIRVVPSTDEPLSH